VRGSDKFFKAHGPLIYSSVERAGEKGFHFPRFDLIEISVRLPPMSGIRKIDGERYRLNSISYPVRSAL
jgi:hypothetical protein